MKIPRAILAAQDYRKLVLGIDGEEEDSELEVGEESAGTIPADLTLDEQLPDVRARTNYALIQLYEQKGYDVFKRVCINMKEDLGYGEGGYGYFKGESAEVYLYVTIKEFIEKFELPWRVYLSMVLPHANGQKDATTEMDIIIASHEMVTVFEAKSYNGSKTITDICTIKRSSDTRDIFKQNSLHCESLIKQIKPLNLNSGKGVKSALFSFALGSLKDVREPRYKKLMPLVTEDNLLAYLTALTKLTTKNWSDELFPKLDQLSQELTMEDHMRYINSIKKGGAK